MVVKIQKSWRRRLDEDLKQPYFIKLIEFVKKEYSAGTCYPIEQNIFAAFNKTSFEDIKVVLIGQDPYHGHNQANGLCFSVNRGVRHPPSLINIFKELKSDLGKEPPVSGNLERWAKQGVLLLNATLTVRANEPGSHQKQGWEQFTNAVITKLSKEKSGLIFLLWGGYAKKKVKLIDRNRHHVLTAGHPSPLSANRGYWFENKHFSKVNSILVEKGEEPIIW